MLSVESSSSQKERREEAGVPKKDGVGTQIKGTFNKVVGKITGADKVPEYNP